MSQLLLPLNKQKVITMKTPKLVILLFAPFVFSTASALTEIENRLCQERENAAMSIGYARYEGVPISKILQAIEKIHEDDGASKSLAIEMALSIYELPAYPPGELQDRAIREEANKAYISCYRAFLNRNSDKE